MAAREVDAAESIRIPQEFKSSHGTVGVEGPTGILTQETLDCVPRERLATWPSTNPIITRKGTDYERPYHFKPLAALQQRPFMATDPVGYIALSQHWVYFRHGYVHNMSIYSLGKPISLLEHSLHSPERPNTFIGY